MTRHRIADRGAGRIRLSIGPREAALIAGALAFYIDTFGVDADPFAAPPYAAEAERLAMALAAARARTFKATNDQRWLEGIA